MRRPRRKAEETREDILQAAARLFRARGFSGVSIADIANELDMSPANIFKHFSSKLALGRETAYQHAETLAKKCSAHIAELAPEERLTGYLSLLASEHSHDMTENRYLFEMIPLVFEDPLKEGRMYRRLIESELAVLIADGMKQGIYRQGDPACDSIIVLDMLASVLNPKMLECADRATLDCKTQLMLNIIDDGLKCRVAK